MIFKSNLKFLILFLSITMYFNLNTNAIADMDYDETVETLRTQFNFLEQFKKSLPKTIELSEKNNKIVAEVIDDYSTFAATINSEIKKEEFANKLTEDTIKNGVRSTVLARMLSDLDNSYQIKKINYARVLNPLINRLNPEIGELLNRNLGLERELEDIKTYNNHEMSLESLDSENEFFENEFSDRRDNLFKRKLNYIVDNYKNSNLIDPDMDREIASLNKLNSNKKSGPISGLPQFNQFASTKTDHSFTYPEMLGCAAGCSGAIATHIFPAAMLPPSAPIRAAVATAICITNCAPIITKTTGALSDWIEDRFNSKPESKKLQDKPLITPAPAPAPAAGNLKEDTQANTDIDPDAEDDDDESSRTATPVNPRYKDDDKNTSSSKNDIIKVEGIITPINPNYNDDSNPNYSPAKVDLRHPAFVGDPTKPNYYLNEDGTPNIERIIKKREVDFSSTIIYRDPLDL
ncbi:MAG: hypothetical protein HQK51_03670 [Oligoflexia bacterium]|nr:hypothetical protein [Oligoflexia bacterium]